MASPLRLWIVGAVTALEAGCLLGVASLGRVMLPFERALVAPGFVTVEIAPRPTEARSDLEAARVEAEPALDRVAIPEVAAEERDPPRAETSRAASKESEFYADFLQIAAREPESFDRITRRAIGEGGPECRSVAALRALCDTRSPTADEALVAAILELPDVCSGHSESVPGFALRRLSMRARQDAGARRALEGLVFGPPQAPNRLRAAAVAALLETADAAELPRIAERLRVEADEFVLGGARTALSRNPQTVAAESARASLGLADPPAADIAVEEE